MENQKKENIFLNLVSNHENYMSSFRENIVYLKKKKSWSVRVLAENAGMSEDTLNTFLKGTSKDCNLSTAVKLARALNVSLDELVGAETVKPVAREAMGVYRNLSESDQYLIRWFVNYLMRMSLAEEDRSMYRSIMELDYEYGHLKITSIYHRQNISKVPADLRHKIFFGITMPCDNYMPLYSPYDTLLIANDREAMNNEKCLIRIKKNLYIVKKKIENGETKYYSIRDGKFRLTNDEIDEKIGYVVGYLNQDGSWGVR